MRVLEDGTELNLFRRPSGDGLKLIGKNRTRATILDRHVHATLAARETDLPPGVFGLSSDPVKARSQEKAARCETERWLEGFTEIADTVHEIGGRTCGISMCDRKANRSNLSKALRRRPRIELLARAKYECVLGNGQPELFHSGNPPTRLPRSTRLSYYDLGFSALGDAAVAQNLTGELSWPTTYY